MPRRALASLVLSVCAIPLTTALGQDPPAPAPGGRVRALVGGTLIDGFGSVPIRNSVILIEGDRITAVGQVGSLAVPQAGKAAAEVISTEGMTVLPGLWDMHVHTMIAGHADYAHWDKTYPAQFESVIMPASARQLLMAGVTSARDLGAPLEPSISVRDRINAGKIPGPTLYVSGPFIQHEPYPGTEAFRWGVTGADDARAKVDRLAKAGADVIKLIDQDQMTLDEVRAVVEQAHRHRLPVVAHSHRPEEIRRGLAVGVDCFEHTGLSSAPEYPPEIIAAVRERTAQMSLGPLWWTPTVEGLLNYEYLRDNPEFIDDPAWHEGLPTNIVQDIRKSLEHTDRLPYYQLTPARRPTLRRKFQQLREAGVVQLIGTDSGIPMQFHTQSTWRELHAWVNEMGVAPIEAIRAATYWPAVAMKKDTEVGTVTPGKYADIIAVRGDALRDIALLQRVDVVVKHGVRYR
ncbi:MAG TPA: amidohydrolase family protein [Vicinamibacterales bacterium]|nr:amidohydrolase family protein [Vicinamibacterales bacterium]